MAGVTKAVNEKLYKEVEKALSECNRNGEVSNKLQALKAVKKFGVKHVAEVFEVSRVSVMKWIKAFASDGIEGLKLKAGRGRKSIVTIAEETVIESWIREDSSMTIKKLQFKIERDLGKKIGKSATHNLMRDLGYSYITPRPVHHKQDKGLHAEFKKKSTKDKAIQSK